MGKRSNFERNPRDYYPTPEEAVFPLLREMKICPNRPELFIEPCAGDGRLIRHLEKYGMICKFACDIEPKGPNIVQRDVLYFDKPFPKAEHIITNPPWARHILHPMIEGFRTQAPTWLLLDADWMFTGQAKPYLRFCDRIVSVGRISWMENGVSGFDNCCWYRFRDKESETVFRP